MLGLDHYERCVQVAQHPEQVTSNDRVGPDGILARTEHYEIVASRLLQDARSRILSSSQCDDGRGPVQLVDDLPEAVPLPSRAVRMLRVSLYVHQGQDATEHIG